MSPVVELLCSRRVPQVAVLALISLSFAGCSADMSSRLSQANFSNPFNQDATGFERKELVDVRFVPALPGVAREL